MGNMLSSMEYKGKHLEWYMILSTICNHFLTTYVIYVIVSFFVTLIIRYTHTQRERERYIYIYIEGWVQVTPDVTSSNVTPPNNFL